MDSGNGEENRGRESCSCWWEYACSPGMGFSKSAMSILSDRRARRHWVYICGSASLIYDRIDTACTDGGHLLDIWTEDGLARISRAQWLPDTLEWAWREAKESTVEMFQAPEWLTLMEYNMYTFFSTVRRSGCNSHGHSRIYYYGQSCFGRLLGKQEKLSFHLCRSNLTTFCTEKTADSED